MAHDHSSLSSTRDVLADDSVVLVGGNQFAVPTRVVENPRRYIISGSLVISFHRRISQKSRFSAYAFDFSFPVSTLLVVVHGLETALLNEFVPLSTLQILPNHFSHKIGKTGLGHPAQFGLSLGRISE